MPVRDPASAAGTGRTDRNRPAPRLLLPTDRADLRVTWHQDDDLFVLSLWHDDACVGTAPLQAQDAAAVASFLVTQLGERGRWTPRVVEGVDPVSSPGSRPLLQRLLQRVRRHL